MARIAVLILLVPLVVLLFLGSLLIAADMADQNCDSDRRAFAVDPVTVPSGPIAGYQHEQLVNAAHIMAAAHKLGLNARDQQIGVMTAMGESGLRVIDYGDEVGPDSRGLFQQRDNGAWGSYADRMDPFTSATNFFRVLSKVTQRESMPPTRVAHAVQRNADENHYARWWSQAGQVVHALGGASLDSSPATPGGYNLGAVNPQTALVANTVGHQFNVATVNSVGSKGLSISFVLNDAESSRRVAEHLISNSRSLKVTNVIWQQQIWTDQRADEGWLPIPESQRGHRPLHVTATVLPTSPDASSSPSGDCRPEGVAGDVSPSGWAAPANGPVTSRFGPRPSPGGIGSTWHRGIDFGPGCGQPIWAANAGHVVRAGPSRGYGNLIEIAHGNGVSTRYAHMFDNGMLVRNGDRVHAGQQIAKVGNSGNSTGCHLHFEVLVDRERVNPDKFFMSVGAPIGGRTNRQ